MSRKRQPRRAAGAPPASAGASASEPPPAPDREPPAGAASPSVGGRAAGDPPAPDRGGGPAAALATLAVVLLVIGGFVAYGYRQGGTEPAEPATATAGARIDDAGQPVDPATWQVLGMPMAERLAAIAAALDTFPMYNPFANTERVAYLKAQGPPASAADREVYQARLATNLLYSGQTEEAIRILEAIEADLAADPGADPAELRVARTMLATAWLRLGEQTNCIRRHSADACLLPIQEAGLQLDSQGAEQAMVWYRKILETNPDDLAARWMLNLAAMVLGSHPQAVPPEFQIPESVFASEAELPRFPDIAPELGLDLVSLAGGAVMDDLDGDNDLDLAFSSMGIKEPLRIYFNQGDGRFVEAGAEAGIEGQLGGLNLSHADYDNDGDLDLFVARGAWFGEQGLHPNSLLRNEGGGRFTDVTEAAGLLSFHPTQVAAWADYDNDGWLDLFVGNETLDPAVRPVALGDEAARAGETWEHPAELYRNRGDGSFEERAAEAGLAMLGFIKGASWGDYDNDGRQDLYVSCHGCRNRLFRNAGPDGEGVWRFEDVTGAAGVESPSFSFSSWFFDYDNDGWLDIFVADYGQPRMGRTEEYLAGLLGQSTEGDRPYLYRNRGDGTFQERGAWIGLDRPTFTMGANTGDIDGDGWPDIYLGTGDPQFESLFPNLMFRNDAGRGFQDVTTAGGFGHIQKGHGIAFGDIDHDGDQDLLVNLGGAYSGDGYQKALFANPGSGGRWLTLGLEGTRSNRSAIGARVRVDVDTPTGPRSIHALAGAGGSFGANSLRQEIGLGDATAIRAVSVTWPATGETQVFEGLGLDSAWRLIEGQAAPEPWDLAPIPLPGP